MDRLDVSCHVNPLQGIGTPYPWALDRLSLWMSVTMHTQVPFDGGD